MTKLFGRILITVFLSLVIIACEKEEIFENTIKEELIDDYNPIELELMKLVNEHRTEIGLKSLFPLNLVTKEASLHTDYMVTQEKISHDNFEIRTSNLFNNAGVKSVGENVGFGYKTAKNFLNGWLSNAGHREILESKTFTHFGISAKKNSEERFYVTHIFIKKE